MYIITNRNLNSLVVSAVQAGGMDVMASRYKMMLSELEYQEPKDEAHISSAYERFGRIL